MPVSSALERLRRDHKISPAWVKSNCPQTKRLKTLLQHLFTFLFANFYSITKSTRSSSGHGYTRKLETMVTDRQSLRCTRVPFTLVIWMYIHRSEEEEEKDHFACIPSIATSYTDHSHSPSCPCQLTHLFLWLAWAPLVARKRAAASFPAPAARCSRQFPTRKKPYSYFLLHGHEIKFHPAQHPAPPHHLLASPHQTSPLLAAHCTSL